MRGRRKRGWEATHSPQRVRYTCGSATPPCIHAQSRERGGGELKSASAHRRRTAVWTDPCKHVCVCIHVCRPSVRPSLRLTRSLFVPMSRCVSTSGTSPERERETEKPGSGTRQGLQRRPLKRCCVRVGVCRSLRVSDHGPRSRDWGCRVLPSFRHCLLLPPFVGLLRGAAQGRRR